MLSIAQKCAITSALDGHNLYIGGQAGTGKTYLLQQIYASLKNQSKSVYLTCTTGIACANFADCGAQTIHRWSGINDGRYDITKMQEVIENYKKETHERICETDTLIIDEISMLSQKQFELVEKACATKNKDLPFGGIQVILSGDFYQLPPVRNILYHDEGKFCFQSAIFQQAISHKIILNKVIRQNDPQFIKVVNEISVGKISSDTENFVKELSENFSSQKCESLKLYATNDLVEKQNRNSIVRWPGEISEYASTDSGRLDYLHRVLAPPVLWLKNGCPVILLQNISEKLFNGLRGNVISCDSDGPTVHFPSVKITRKLRRESFSVYCPDLKKNVAERVQIPLKLAFALTVHKAQGMTLERVEVDCRNMFAPGQLGVAISRVRSASDVRVINFNASACIPQTNIIADFLEVPSCCQKDDFTCCRYKRLISNDLSEEIVIPGTPDTPTCPVDTDFEDMEFEDNILSALHETATIEPETETTCSLPAEFSISKNLRDLYVKNAVTHMQMELNEVIDIICNSKKFVQNVQTFCEDEFSFLIEIIESIQFGTEPKAIKSDKLTDLYRACHIHQTSTHYKVRVLLMFFDLKRTISQQVMSHISYNLTVSIRKHLLSDLESKYSTCIADRPHTVQRKITEESYGKIRYVGGYCVAKVRQKYIKQLRFNCYKLGIENQARYKESCLMLGIIDSMSVNESIISSSSQYTSSLIETCRKQNVTRGLTNISDTLFAFFVSTCEVCLTLLVHNNVNIHFENLFQFCSAEMNNKYRLFEEFVKCVCTKYMPEDLDKDQFLVPMLVSEMLDTVCAVEQLFKELTENFLMVMFNQFRKDFLLSLCVEKKMAHRKQILVRTKHSPKEVKVDMSLIFEDDSEGKVVSHNLLRSIILKNEEYLECMSKKDLVLLCKAYDCQIKSRHSKKEIISKLNPVIECAESIPLAGLLKRE